MQKQSVSETRTAPNDSVFVPILVGAVPVPPTSLVSDVFPPHCAPVSDAEVFVALPTLAPAFSAADVHLGAVSVDLHVLQQVPLVHRGHDERVEAAVVPVPAARGCKTQGWVPG